MHHKAFIAPEGVAHLAETRPKKNGWRGREPLRPEGSGRGGATYPKEEGGGPREQKAEGERSH